MVPAAKHFLEAFFRMTCRKIANENIANKELK